MAYHCPHCQAVVLSRRNRLCGFCQQPLPAEVVFPPEQVQAIKAEEAARSQAAHQRAEEKRLQALKSRGSSDAGGG